MIVKGLLETAVERHRAGQLTEALELYRRVLADDPGNIDALHLAGVALNRLGDHEEAVTLIEQAVKAGPPQAHMLFNLANAYRFAGRTDEAVLSYREALARDPGNEAAHAALWETLHADRRIRTVVIASSDAGFFDLTRDLMLSLQDCRAANTPFDIGFLDAGCSPEQVAWFRRQNIQVVPVTAGPAHRVPEKPLHTMAQTCRPYLREYFPGYDVYIWFDADIWIQNPHTIATFVSLAIRTTQGIVAIREIDPGYVTLNRSTAAQTYYSLYHSRCAAFCPPEIMERLLFVPMFNSGVFAMHKDSQGWAVWAKHLDMALSGGYTHMIDQYAFNTAIAELGKVTTLPSAYNWICSQCTPVRNSMGKVCKPYFPFEELSVVHLTATSQTYGGVKFIDLYRERRLVYERASSAEPVMA